MKKIPMLEKFAAQSLVYADTGLDDGKELIFSKEKFAELIVRECAKIVEESFLPDAYSEPCLELIADDIRKHFGVE